MLRKLAAGTSAAVVAAGLTAAPALAPRLPTTPEDSCGDVAQSGHNPAEGVGPAGFVFGPFADVPHLLLTDRSRTRHRDSPAQG